MMESKEYIGCTICATLILAPYFAFSESILTQRDTISINQLTTYNMQQYHQLPGGVIDPYTGEELELDTSIQNEYIAPYMSYHREQQPEDNGYGLNYQVGENTTLNYDPRTKRLHSEMKFGSSKKTSLKFRLNPKRIKATFIYKLN